MRALKWTWRSGAICKKTSSDGDISALLNRSERNSPVTDISPAEIYARGISNGISEQPFTKFNVKITYLKFHWNIPGASELN